MRIALLVLVVVCAAVSCGVCGDLPAAPKTTFAAVVHTQARVNVDDKGAILSIFNTTDGSGNKPEIFNVYCGEVNIAMTPTIQTNLDALTSTLNWKEGGFIYTAPSAEVNPKSEARNSSPEPP